MSDSINFKINVEIEKAQLNKDIAIVQKELNSLRGSLNNLGAKNLTQDLISISKKLNSLGSLLKSLDTSKFSKLNASDLSKSTSSATAELNQLKTKLNEISSSKGLVIGNSKDLSYFDELNKKISSAEAKIKELNSNPLDAVKKHREDVYGTSQKADTSSKQAEEDLLRARYKRQQEQANKSTERINYSVKDTAKLDSYEISGRGRARSVLDRNVLNNDVAYAKNALSKLQEHMSSVDTSKFSTKSAQSLLGVKTYAEQLRKTMGNLKFNDLDTKEVSSAFSEINSKLIELELEVEAKARKIKLDLGRNISSGVAKGLHSQIQEDLRNIDTEVREATMNNFRRQSTINVDANNGTGATEAPVESPNVSGISQNMSLSTLQSSVSRISSMAGSMLSKIYSTSSSVIKKSASLTLSVYTKTFSTLGSLFKKVFNVGDANSSLDGISSKISGLVRAIAPMASLYGVFRVIKESVTLGGDMVELQNVVDATFKGMSGSINEFTDNAMTKFGLTAKEAKKFSGIFGAMFQSSGITGSNLDTMSKNLTALSGDLSSFYNTNRDDMFKKLQSGLAGNVMPLRAIGINMTKANLGAYALSKGIKTSYADMNQASQTALRYNYILEHTAIAQGDFSRTSKSWANQVRILQGSWQTFLTILGQGLVTVLYPLLKALNSIMSSVNSGMTSLSKSFGFTQKDLEGMFGTGGLTDYSDGLQEATDGTDALADATANASSQLAGFDKLNNISDSKSNKASNLGADIAFPVQSYFDNVKDVKTTALDGVFKKIADKLASYWSDIKGVDYKPLVNSFSTLKNQLKPLVNDIGAGIDWMWHNALYPFYKWSAEQGVPSVFNLMGEGARSLHLVLNAVAPTIDSFWREHLAPFFKQKGDSFVNLINTWTLSLKAWNDGLEKSTDKVNYLKTTLNSWYSDFKSKHPEVASRLASIYEKIAGDNGIFGYIKNNGSSIRQTVSNILDGFMNLGAIVIDGVVNWAKWLLEHSESISLLFQKIVTWFGQMGDMYTGFFQDIFSYILDHQDEVMKLLNVVKDDIKAILDFVSNHKDEIFSILKFIVERLGLITGALLFTKGIAGIGNLLLNLGLLKLAFGSLLGAGGIGGLGTGIASATGAIGGFSSAIAPLLAIVGIPLLTVFASKTWFDDIDRANAKIDDAKKKEEELRQSKMSAKPTLASTDVSSNIDIKNPNESSLKGMFEAYAPSEDTVNNAFRGLNDKLDEEKRKLIDTFDAGNIDQAEFDKRMDELKVSASKTADAISSSFSKAVDIGGANKAVSDYNALLSDTSEKMVRLAETGTGSFDNLFVRESEVRQSLAQLGQYLSDPNLKNLAIEASVDTTKSKADLLNTLRDIVTEVRANKDYYGDVEADMKLSETSAEEFKAKCGQTGVDGVTSVAQGMESNSSSVSSAASTISDQAQSQFDSDTSEYVSIGDMCSKGLLQGLFDGIAGGLSALKTSAGSIIDAVKAKFDIHSPSRVFKSIGDFCMKGLSLGFTGSTSSTISTVRGISDNILGVASNSLDFSKLAPNSLETKFYSSFDNILSKSKDFSASLGETLRDFSINGQANLQFAYNKNVSPYQKSMQYSDSSSQGKSRDSILSKLEDLEYALKLEKSKSDKDKAQIPDVHVYIGNDSINDHIVKTTSRTSTLGGKF